MTDAVYIKSGEQPRYFAFSGSLSAGVPATSTPVYKESPFSSFQGIVQGSGAVSATIIIEFTNDPLTISGVNSNWLGQSTITLSGAGSATDGFVTSGATWKWARARVTSISGTNAFVQVIMGV